MTALNESMGRDQNCYMDTDSFVIYIKTEDFMKIFQMTLKDGLIHLTMTVMIKDRFQ